MKIMIYSPVIGVLLRYLNWEDLYFLAIFSSNKCNLIALATAMQLKRCVRFTPKLELEEDQEIDTSRLKNLPLTELFPEHCWLHFVFRPDQGVSCSFCENTGQTQY